MKKNLHLIYTPFTGVGLHGGFRGQTWFNHRIEIFKKYTLKSLLNQSNRDFLHWMSFRPEERYNPLVHDLANALRRVNYRFLFTFDGLMYWDDKFNNFSFRTRIKNGLRMLWDMYWYKEWKSPKELWRHTWENKNDNLPKRVSRSLSTIRHVLENTYNIHWTELEWVYLTRIDSDDMFHKDAVDLIQSQSPAIKKSLIFDEGYILNANTGQLAEWNPPTNPPFHTIIFTVGTFFSPFLYLNYYGDFRTHEDITTVFNCEVLDTKKFCVGYHGKHISTDWESPAPKKLYHTMKYGFSNPFKGYCYTTSGRNISTQWESRSGRVKNPMIGRSIANGSKTSILKDFGIES